MSNGSRNIDTREVSAIIKRSLGIDVMPLGSLIEDIDEHDLKAPIPRFPSVIVSGIITLDSFLL